MSRIAAALLHLLLVVPAAVAKGPTQPTQLWSIDLSSDPDFAKRVRAENPMLRPPQLDFLDDERIIVAFDDNSSSVSGLEMRPFGFQVLEVDARKGKPGQKRSWQVQNDTSQAMAVGNGNLLVLAGEQLKELSGAFEELASVSTPLKLHGNPTPMHSGQFLNPYYERWQIDVAPGGTSVILAHDIGQDATIEWLASSDLRRISSTTLSDVGLNNVLAGDEFALLSVRSLPALLVTPSGEHRPVCECPAQKAFVLTDDLIFLAVQREYKIVTMSGQVRSSSKLKVEADKFCRTRGGDRFALAADFYKGSGFPLQTEFAPRMTVQVFDSQTLKQIAEKTFQEPVVRGFSQGFHQSAIALSPDGHRLLVLIDSTLSLYQIQ